MNKSSVLLSLLVVVLLVPLATASKTPVDQNGNRLPFASPIGIVSPMKFANYTTNLLTLNVSQTILAASNIHYTLTYSIDGKANESLPFVTKPAYEGSILQGFLIGTVDLPMLSDGPHYITIYEAIEIVTATVQTGAASDTVYFTINTGAPNGIIFPQLTDSEKSMLIGIGVSYLRNVLPFDLSKYRIIPLEPYAMPKNPVELYTTRAANFNLTSADSSLYVHFTFAETTPYESVMQVEYGTIHYSQTYPNMSSVVRFVLEGYQKQTERNCTEMIRLVSLIDENTYCNATTDRITLTVSHFAIPNQMNVTSFKWDVKDGDKLSSIVMDFNNGYFHSLRDGRIVDEIVTEKRQSRNVSANLTENTWTTKAAMPTARYRFGTAVVNGSIYAIGGFRLQAEGNFSYSITTNVNEVYHPSTDTWTAKAPSPISGDFPVAAFQDKIYCFGHSKVCIYDPATNIWETKAVPAMDISGSDANAVGNRIYVLGRQTQVYNPTSDSWTTKTPMPIPVNSYASTVVDGKIYIISGSTGFANSLANNTQIYDPISDSWSMDAPIPIAVSNAAAGTSTGSNLPKAIYVLGGSNKEHPLNGQVTNQVYFPDNGTWAIGASMLKDKAGLSVDVVDNILYAVGGGHNIFMPDSTDVMQYTPFGVGAANPIAQPSPPTSSPSASPTPKLTPETKDATTPSASTTPPELEPTATPDPSEAAPNSAIAPKQSVRQSLPQEIALGVGFASVIAVAAAGAFTVGRRCRMPKS